MASWWGKDLEVLPARQRRLIASTWIARSETSRSGLVWHVAGWAILVVGACLVLLWPLRSRLGPVELGLAIALGLDEELPPPPLASITIADPALHAAWVFEVLVSGVMEELVFRGVLLHALAVRWGTWPAVMVSTFVFGALHGTAALGASLLGLVMAVIYVRTGSLLVPVVAHAAQNLIVYEVCWARVLEAPAAWLDTFAASVPASAVALGIGVVAVAAACVRSIPVDASGLPYARSQAARHAAA